jgi:hypothetical protein
MAENGNKRKVYLVENTTNTYVVGQTSGGFSLNDELLDASDKTHEWAEYISGKKAWSATIGVNLDNTASSMQIKFLESLVEGTKVKVFIGVLDADKQSDGILGEAFVASVEDTFDNGAISSRSITLTGTGEAIIVKPA